MFLNKVEICGVNTSELPLLSDEEKENLFIQIEQGNMDAREQYVKGNLRLVLSVIQRFSSNHEHADDLFQVGCIGLMKAIDNFDRTLNVKFSTYAVPMIMGEIRRFCRDDGMLKVSRTLKTLAAQAAQMREKTDKRPGSGYYTTGTGRRSRNYIRRTFACIGSNKRCGKPIRIFV